MDNSVGLNKLADNTTEDNERAAKVIAKSFFKILIKSGFSDNQIISVTNNILDCLIQTLDGYKGRTSPLSS